MTYEQEPLDDVWLSLGNVCADVVERLARKRPQQHEAAGEFPREEEPHVNHAAADANLRGRPAGYEREDRSYSDSAAATIAAPMNDQIEASMSDIIVNILGTPFAPLQMQMQRHERNAIGKSPKRIGAVTLREFDQPLFRQDSQCARVVTGDIIDRDALKRFDLLLRAAGSDSGVLDHHLTPSLELMRAPSGTAAARAPMHHSEGSRDTSELVGRAVFAPATPRPVLTLPLVAAERRCAGSEFEFSCAVSRATGVALSGASVLSDAGMSRGLLAEARQHFLRRRGRYDDVRLLQRGAERDGLDAIAPSDIIGRAAVVEQFRRLDDIDFALLAGATSALGRLDAEPEPLQHADRVSERGRLHAEILRGNLRAAFDDRLNEIVQVLVCIFRHNASDRLCCITACVVSGGDDIRGGQNAKPRLSHETSGFTKHAPRIFVDIDEFQPKVAYAVFAHMRQHPRGSCDALFLFIARHDTRSHRPLTTTSAAMAAHETAPISRTR